MYEIENISFDEFKAQQRSKNPIQKLDVGQSFFVSADEMSNAAARVFAHRNSISKKKFKTKAVDGGTRIFRVK